MSTTIRISSNNFSGQTANITFYPDTGGTVNIGDVVIPYDYTADYIYGNYDLYFSAYTKTCSVIVDNNYLLQEDGFYLLQEDGSKIIIT
jgi:hypothetical protein